MGIQGEGDPGKWGSRGLEIRGGGGGTGGGGSRGMDIQEGWGSRGMGIQEEGIQGV